MRRVGGRAEWQGLVSSAAQTRERFGEWLGTVEEQIKERPGSAVIAATAAGFALGGGLLTGFTFRLARVSLVLALRAAALGGAVQALARATETRGGRRVVDVSGSA